MKNTPNMAEFNALLLEHYDTGETAKTKPFLYENAIEGMGTYKKTAKNAPRGEFLTA